MLIVNDECVRVLAFRRFAARVTGEVGVLRRKGFVRMHKLNRIFYRPQAHGQQNRRASEHTQRGETDAQPKPRTQPPCQRIGDQPAGM